MIDEKRIIISNTMNRLCRILVLPLVLTAALPHGVHADYSKHELAPEFIQKMVAEHGFEAEDVKAILAQAEKKQSILDAISRPAEKTKKWHEYRNIFLGEKRINQGVKFWQENSEAITKASNEFGVAPEIIVAIIGVETRYGRHAGKFRVVDALATLGFDYPRRAKFFRGQLEHFLLLAKEQNVEPMSLVGSYAGAMGYGQFIPSSYRSFAVDFDGDKKADIWNNPTDAIGSVANYFSEHKWREGEPVLTRARFPKNYDKSLINQSSKPKLTVKEIKSEGFVPTEDRFADDLLVKPLMYEGKHGKEFWLGFHNFYVITRYNRSRLYAMAVWELSQEIKERKTQL